MLRSGKFRIVTTNYDRHLSESVSEQVEEYGSPAVPIGLRGIVYLHGSIRQDPELLVVTATDFGEAYFNIPWATEFLKLMFRDSTVLFIGYSHSDVLMQYLGRGLPPTSQRYAFCVEGKVADWRRLGITPVVYGQHEGLPKAVERWANQARMGMTDHDRRVRGIVEGAPQLERDDQSYLEETVAHAVRVRFFTNHARGLPWLRWLTQQPQFATIFEPSTTAGKAGHALASWFCKHYAANSEYADEALQIIAEKGGRLGPALAGRIVHALSAHSGDAGLGTLARWLPLVVAEELPAGGRRRLWQLLLRCDPVRDRAMVLLLFDYLATPVPDLSRPSLMPSVGADGSNRYWFTKTWERILEPNLEALASDLAPVIDRHLRQAHLITQVGRDPLSGPDSISRSRPAIEPHEQNQPRRYSKNIDPLIDAARDTLSALLRGSPDEGLHYLRSWSQSVYPLLQRLAIHGWAQRNDANSDEKLRWLLNNVALFDWHIRHEAMQLIAIALPDASEACANELVAHVAEHRQAEPASDQQDWRTYQYLGWILQYSPALRTAQEELALIQADHPGWTTPEHPDFPIWTEVKPNESGRAMPSVDLHARIAASPAEAVAYLIKEASQPVHEWADTSQQVNATVKDYPGDGVLLLRELVDSCGSEPAADLRVATAVISALEPALSERPPPEGLIELLPRVWAIGTRRWTDGTDTHTPDKDWLYRAINHWAGMAALVAVRLLAHSSQDNTTQVPFPDPLRAVFNEMITGTDEASRYAQVVLASQLYFLYRTDTQWSLTQVLPLLDPNADRERALRCWDGYLTWGRNDQKLLDAGLLNHYVNLVPHLHCITWQPRRAFSAHLADVALYSGINPIENGWLSRFTSSAQLKDRIEWIGWVAQRLRNMPVEAAEAQWHAWISTYWQNRLASRPRLLTLDEASATTEWAFTLSDSFPQAVEMASSNPPDSMNSPESPSGSNLPTHLIPTTPTPDPTTSQHTPNRPASY